MIGGFIDGTIANWALAIAVGVSAVCVYVLAYRHAGRVQRMTGGEASRAHETLTLREVIERRERGARG